MDHPEVRAWLEEAALEPGGLERPPASDIAVHLESCSACTAERDALRATAAVLDLAMGPSLAARNRVLANVRQLGRERGRVAATPPVVGVASASGGRFAWRQPSLAAAMLGLALVVFVAGAMAGALYRGAGTDAEPGRLPEAVAEMADIASDPGATHLTLRDAGGTPAGMVVHSPTTARLAVISGPLPGAAGTSYWCYLERDGQRLPIGPMHVEDGTHFWAGPMDGAIDAGRPGDRFVVMIEDSDGPAVLFADF